MGERTVPHSGSPGGGEKVQPTRAEGRPPVLGTTLQGKKRYGFSGEEAVFEINGVPCTRHTHFRGWVRDLILGRRCTQH